VKAHRRDGNGQEKNHEEVNDEARVLDRFEFRGSIRDGADYEMK
jgi:hypothetical protein